MRMRHAVGIGLAIGWASAAVAQQDGFYTTHDEAKKPAVPYVEPAQPLPWLKQPAQQPQTLPPSYKPSVPDPNAIPFQRGSSMPNSYQPVIQGGPAQQAVPVENLDAVEVTEPAAPSQPVVGANPAEEDPAAPTELTSPLFSAEVDTKTPRTIALRVLNKVTARAETLVLKPGEEVEFGKLRIRAQNCYRSVPTSQPDSVALLDIKEHIPDQQELKELFHGWMYASSPSITALEHPVYDVALADCRMAASKPADATKDEKSDKKNDAKPAEKQKN